MRKPWVCAKCGHEATSEVALNRHLEQADHVHDLDYPLFAARVRMEADKETVRAAKDRLDASITEYGRLKADWRMARMDRRAGDMEKVTCGHVSEFGVCIARRGHLLGHYYAITERRADPYPYDMNDEATKEQDA